MPKVTVDQLRRFLTRMPQEVRDDYRRRHFSLFVYIIQRFTSTEWVEAQILRRNLRNKPGDEDATGFFQLEFSPDEVRELKSLRVFDLAEMLINLQLVPGFDDCVARLKTGDAHQIESTYAELQFGKLLYVHDVNFRFVIPSGKRGENYDFEFSLPSHPVVCADAKCKLESTDIDAQSVLDSLDTARKQLPRDKPGIVFVKVPQHWFDQQAMAGELRRLAHGFLRNTQRVVSVKYYISHVSFTKDQQTLHRHAFEEITNPKTKVRAEELGSVQEV